MRIIQFDETFQTFHFNCNLTETIRTRKSNEHTPIFAPVSKSFQMKRRAKEYQTHKEHKPEQLSPLDQSSKDKAYMRPFPEMAVCIVTWRATWIAGIWSSLCCPSRWTWIFCFGHHFPFQSLMYYYLFCISPI